jgi:hypothetical protein
MPGHDLPSFLVFAVPCLIIVVILLVIAAATGEKKPTTPAGPTPGEAELLAEIRELKKRRILEKGGAA